MKHLIIGITSVLCGVLCLSALIACRPDSDTTTISTDADEPSPYADLTPAEVYSALEKAEQFQITAYSKVNTNGNLTMSRKILQKSGEQYRIHTESYDGKQAVRSTTYADAALQRTYEKNNGKWEYFTANADSLDLSPKISNTLEVSALFPSDPLFADEHYTLTDSETDARSMSEDTISSILKEKAKKTSISFAYDSKSDTYTVSGSASQTGERGITIKHTLIIEICFAENTLTIPESEDGEAYPPTVPQDIYRQIMEATQMSLTVKGPSHNDTILRAEDRVRIQFYRSGIYCSYFYDLSHGIYYTSIEKQWYAKQTDQTLTTEEILNTFSFADYFYLLDASNYAAPEKGATAVSFSADALSACNLKSASYTYNKTSGKHQFTCLPKGKDTAITFTVVFAPQTVNLPDADPTPYLHMTPDELGNAIHSPGQYNIVRMDNSYNNLYIVNRDGNLVEVIDNLKKQTLYYDLDAHTVYAKKNGQWICSADTSADRWTEILRMMDLEVPAYYESSRYEPFNWILLSQSMENHPTKLKTLNIHQSGWLYRLQITVDNGSVFGKTYRAVIEFGNVSVELPS